MHRDFARDFESLTAMYEFAEEVFEANDIGEAARFSIHLAMEEVFTNMVKYGPGADAEIGVDIVVNAGAVKVILTEDDVDEFDVTRPSNVDTGASLADRTPGGLGLHLLQNMVDNLEYQYLDRRSRVIFTKESG